MHRRPVPNVERSRQEKRAQGELTNLDINPNARVRVTSDEMPELAMLAWAQLRDLCA